MKADMNMEIKYIGDKTEPIASCIRDMKVNQAIYFDNNKAACNTVRNAIQRLKANGQEYRTTTKTGFDKTMFDSLMKGEPLLKVTRVK